MPAETGPALIVVEDTGICRFVARGQADRFRNSLNRAFDRLVTGSGSIALSRLRVETEMYREENNETHALPRGTVQEALLRILIKDLPSPSRK